MMREDLKNNGWTFSDEVISGFSEYDRSFVTNEFLGRRSFQYYQARLQQIGFSGKTRVLDAACGMGQWSLALASMNQFVEAIDLNASRISIAKQLQGSHGVENLNFQEGSIEELPYPDESFDAVFCYGSFMFTNMPKCIGEFARVLKPGGKVYLNANAFGWYLHLLFDRGIAKKNWHMARTSLNMIKRLFHGENSQMMVTSRYMRKITSGAGLRELALSYEGGISIGSTPLVESAYPHKYFGQIAIYEMLLEKNKT